jgi:hypothetical protein
LISQKVDNDSICKLLPEIWTNKNYVGFENVKEDIDEEDEKKTIEVE